MVVLATVMGSVQWHDSLPGHCLGHPYGVSGGLAAAAGTSRIGQKMAEAVTLAKLAGTDQVDRALGVAAVHQRFAHGDLASLLTAAGHRTGMHTATEERSLTQGTAGWAGLGTSNTEGAAR